ncbi:MAG: NapC/NirT family cytochrome c [Gemmatimonadales bacterium]|nr:NapC/NirT family cytochrome c [Gemmatimonadales bacterium]
MVRLLSWALQQWRRTALRWRVTLVLLLSATLIGSSAAGYRQWNYMQHDNRFCTSCHLMQDPFERFNRSAHAQLECHSCHKATLKAQMRQLYLTMVERPTSIGGHADVPNKVCAACHIRGDSTRWRIIATTAGHRVHLESKAPALRGMRCVACHGVTVHEFASVDRTCGQSGCHAANLIRLGGMGQASELHCTTCHNFLAEARTVEVDSLGQPLTPAAAQCLSCHSMQERMVNLDVARDPHGGVCGDCHNPHTQTSPRQVTCASASCHADWRSLGFHVGVAHPERCTTCHLPHSWRVEGQNCLRCHADIGRQSPSRPRAAPARRSALRVRGAVLDLASAADPASVFAMLQLAQGGARDLPRFSHGDHRGQTCASCHSSRVRHGELMVRATADCQRCHHAGPDRQQCASCHAPMDLRRVAAAEPRSFRLLASRATVTRRLPFDHQRHTAVMCAQCHSNPMSRAPESADCASCHASHHRSAANCVACHAGANPLASHRAADHATCATASCHGERAAALPASREACLMCHTGQTRHLPGRNCEQCHRVTAAGSR